MGIILHLGTLEKVLLVAAILLFPALVVSFGKEEEESE